MSLENDIKEVNKKILDGLPFMTRNRNLGRLRYSTLEGKDKIANLTNFLHKTGITEVLEIGCGKGVALNDLAQEYPSIQFKGVDLKTEGSVHSENVNMYPMDAHNLQFADNQFDLVFSFFTFAYLVDKIKALKEVYRVLKPNGQALIHLNPIYFYPNGRELIPSNHNESDVFWDNGFKHVMLAKEGKDVSCLDKPYVGCYHTKLTREYHNPVLSLYSQIPKKELESIKKQETKENAEWLFPIHTSLAQD